MYQELNTPQFRSVSVADAERFLAINDFPGQRPYKPSKGRHYADNMATGAHRRVEIATAYVEETGREYLMNGQHNCNAIVIRGAAYPGIVAKYLCETMEDAWRLFATFDVHASRTEKQFMGARRGLFKDERLHDIPLRVLGACGSALYALGSGEEPQFKVVGERSKTDKADMVEMYPEDVVFVSRYREREHLMRVGIVAAIIATSRQNPTAAIDFWDKVATGEMMSLSDPRMMLRNSLTSIGGKSAAMKFGQHNGQRTLYTVCISWWNSWRSNEPRKAVKIASIKKLPKAAK
jgi:hypothetical protein